MPKGIEAVIEDGFATLDFTDRTLVGPALEKLRLAGSKVTKQTRVGPRAVYNMPEGDAIAAGLLDSTTVRPDHLSYGDTGYAESLQSPQSFCHGGRGGVVLWVDPVSELVMAYFSVLSRGGMPAGVSVPEDLVGGLGQRSDLFVNAATAAIVE